MRICKCPDLKWRWGDLGEWAHKSGQRGTNLDFGKALLNNLLYEVNIFKNSRLPSVQNFKNESIDLKAKFYDGVVKNKSKIFHIISNFLN
jgi:hypothetical protein